MYKVYIRHFYPPDRQDGRDRTRIVDQEELMYEVPHSYPEEEALIDPKVKNEMGKAGSFEFSMESNNPWYTSLLQMTSLLRVVYDDETIFYGRVLAIDTDMWGKRKIHCEGALAFLLDTLIMPTKEEEREEISLETYVKDLIDDHNNLMTDEPNKYFFYGQIPGYYSDTIPAVMRPESENRKFGTGSWTSTMNCLEDLTSKYGGYWRARYNDQDGKLYLDWLLNVFDPEPVDQPLRLAQNIIDMSSTVDVNGIFTVFIPEGTKNGKSLYLDDVPTTVIKIPVVKDDEGGGTGGTGGNGGSSDDPTTPAAGEGATPN